MRRPILALAFSLAVTLPALAVTSPTHENVRYDENFDRQLVDLWLPESDHPTSLILYFHGGGFKQGNKERVAYMQEYTSLPERGIAVASAGYPLLGDVGRDSTIDSKAGYRQILLETVKVVTFLKEHAEEYNLDPDRIIVAGTSAGALIAEYLTYNQDLGIAGCLAIQQPYAVDMIKSFMQKRDVPLIIFNASDTSDKIHSPVYAQAVFDLAESLGIPASVYGTPQSGLPQLPEGKTLLAVALATFNVK